VSGAASAAQRQTPIPNGLEYSTEKGAGVCTMPLTPSFLRKMRKTTGSRMEPRCSAPAIMSEFDVREVIQQEFDGGRRSCALPRRSISAPFSERKSRSSPDGRRRSVTDSDEKPDRVSTSGRRHSLHVLSREYLGDAYREENWEPLTLRGKMDLMKNTLQELQKECESSTTHSVVLNEEEISTLTRVIEHFVNRARVRNDEKKVAELLAEPSYEERLRRIVSNGDIYDARFRKYVHQEYLSDIRDQLRSNGYEGRPTETGLNSIYDSDLESIRKSGVGLRASVRRRQAASFVSSPGQFDLSLDRATLDSLDQDGITFEALAASSEDERSERRRSSIASLKEITNLPAGVVTLLDELMSTVRSWEFNIFELCELGVQFPILHLGTCILGVELGLVSSLRLDGRKLANYLLEVDVNYQGENPYHCALHGADTAQAMLYMMLQCGVGDELSPVESLAAIIAALTHDIGHPGVTGGFLVQTGHDLAMLYNDRSPLENMHAARAFQLLADPEMDFVSHWRYRPLQPRVTRRHSTNTFASPAKQHAPGRRYARFRYTVIEMIIATDNSQHKHLMTEVSQVARDVTAAAVAAMDNEIHGRDMPRGGSGSSNGSATLMRADSERDILSAAPRKGVYSEEHRLFMLKVALHAADVSNPARHWSRYIRWTERLMEEFYCQGDTEKELGFPVSPGFDREHPVPMHAFQRGFILALVQPLLEQLETLPGISLSVLRNQLEENLDHWAEIESEEISSTTPARSESPVDIIDSDDDLSILFTSRSTEAVLRKASDISFAAIYPHESPNFQKRRASVLIQESAPSFRKGRRSIRQSLTPVPMKVVEQTKEDDSVMTHEARY